MTAAHTHPTPGTSDDAQPPALVPEQAFPGHLKLVLEETLMEDHVGASRDLGQLQSLFEDVVRDLNKVLGALQAPTPDTASLSLYLVAVLQFEDIATQVVQRARSRLSLLEGFTSELLVDAAAHATCPREDGRPGEPQFELKQRIECHRDQLRATLRRGVLQQNMDPGDVVLFDAEPFDDEPAREAPDHE